MVFYPEGQFQQFLHCKFKDNIIRLLYIPSLEDGNIFLVVNKYGKVGLYDPDHFGLLHTYCLDLSTPMHLKAPTKHRKLLINEQVPPKCGRTHLIVDAVYAPALQMVIFATTKGILQCFDIGEIETHSLGLDILPRKEFMNLRHEKSPVTLKNKGHVETHRIFDLEEVPSCMEYSSSGMTHVMTEHNIQVSAKTPSKLLIGDTDGGITLVIIDDTKFPFLGHRKIRGVLHKITMLDLRNAGKVKSYKAHNDPVKEIRFLNQRQAIVSCSRDNKFSLFCEDFTGISDSFIVSLPKGVNCLTYSDSLGILGTGCEDGVVRVFRQFSMSMPQMELLGHKSAVIAVEILNVPFSDTPILISFSEDVELRAWDAENFKCLQTMYLSFPIRSTIICKTPEFAKRSVIIHQPQYNPLTQLQTNVDKEKDAQKLSKAGRMSTSSSNIDGDGFIILLYCNSYAKLSIEKNTTHWPFNFDEFVTEFEELSTNFDQRLKKKFLAESKDNKFPVLTKEQENEIEAKAGIIKTELMELKGKIDEKFGSNIYDPEKRSSTLSFQGTQKLYSFDTKRPYRERMLRRSATMFDKIPLYDLKTPRVSLDLGVIKSPK